jgi:hypothetical protein
MKTYQSALIQKERDRIYAYIHSSQEKGYEAETILSGVIVMLRFDKLLNK